MTESKISAQTEQFSTSDLELIAMFLEDAAREFSRHGCNDFCMPNTPELRKIFAAIRKHTEMLAGEVSNVENDESAADTSTYDGDEIYSYDTDAMAYLAYRCSMLVKRPQTTSALTSTEWLVLAEMLLLAYEDHQESAENVCYDLSFNASQENKALMSAVMKSFAPVMNNYDDGDFKERARTSAEQATNIINTTENEDAEIDIPDYWIMYYFANRCKAMSGKPVL